MKSLQLDRRTKVFLAAWLFSLVFYFCSYVIRSVPSVMTFLLEQNFQVDQTAVGLMIGRFYYTYALFALVAGVALDKVGAKYSVTAGVLLLVIGCAFFLTSNFVAGNIGRLLQGIGCAFAFPGSVYLATKAFPAKHLATAIGITQCIGMFGGYVGIHSMGALFESYDNAPAVYFNFWIIISIILLVTAVLLWFIVPVPSRVKERQSVDKVDRKPRMGLLEPFKIVFGNAQSWICGLISGLLFAPTTIFVMIWGVKYFKLAGLEYQDAVVVSSMAALGWVFGSPFLGFVADKIGRRKPVLLASCIVMILCLLQLIFAPDLLHPGLLMFLFGFFSGGTMIAYSVIKEANPDNVKGSATGAMNFITFGVSTLIGPLFVYLFGTGLKDIEVYQNVQHGIVLFWIVGIAIATVLVFMLKETGTAVQHVEIDENKI